ncbi:hypothetical protein AB0L06_20020 [Spirillospora sp. NPDC052269]
MTSRTRVWIGAGIALVVLVGLAAYLVSQGLDKADKWASVIGLFVALIGLGPAVYGIIKDLPRPWHPLPHPWPALPSAVKRAMLTAVSIVSAVALAAIIGYFLENGGNDHVHPHPTITTTPSPDVTLSTTFPASLDSQATDQTPLTGTALLPTSFNGLSDSQTVIDGFTRISGVPASCPSSESGNVKATLVRYHCSQQIEGFYINRSQTIGVSVWVIPLADIQTAHTASTYLKDWPPSEWGLICPPNGPGVGVCQKFTGVNSGAQGRSLTWCHRYLIAATALQVDQPSDGSLNPKLNSITKSASIYSGPQNNTSLFSCPEGQ